MPISLPVKLRALRAEKGWTVREAAKKIGTTVDNLSRIERGMRHPQARTLRKLANAYEVSLESLLTLEEESRAPLAV
jgi:repressor LexA